MSNNVKFYDYSVNVKSAIKEKALAFLKEIGGEIRSQASRNSRRRKSHTADSFKFKIDKENMAVHIGSDYWNAIYEEFGTGEHAINGDGRKGYWIFVKSNGAPKALKGGKTYTKKEARRIMAILRSKGIEAYYTNGKKANRALFRAFTTTEPRIEQVAKKYFGELDK